VDMYKGSLRIKVDKWGSVEGVDDLGFQPRVRPAWAQCTRPLGPCSAVAPERSRCQLPYAHPALPLHRCRQEDYNVSLVEYELVAIGAVSAGPPPAPAAPAEPEPAPAPVAAA